MAYRDVLFAPLTSVFLLTALRTDELPAALEAVVRARRAARVRWSGSALMQRRRAVARAARLVPRNVHRAVEALTDAELIAAAHRQGFAGLPVALTITPTRCAVAVAHAVFDGSGGLDLIHDLLDAAAGLPLPPESQPARRPVLHALRKVRRRDVRAFVDARRHRPRPVVTAAGREAEPQQSTTISDFSLSPVDLQAVRAYREPGRVGRPTLHSRLASLTVAALREVASQGPDVPIWATSDIRHLAEGAVGGNFITREQIGTLLGDQWAPGALAARLVALKGPGQALGLVWGTTGWLLRSALGRKPQPGEEVVLTFATTQRAFPVDVGTVVATSVGGSPTFAFVWQTKGAVHLSVHDAGGRFDLMRFEGAFRSLVRLRAGG